MNSIKFKFFPFLVVFTLIISISSYCNDGGESYWGPDRIHTVEEKTVNTAEKSIKVYKGAGENFEIDERAIVPNGITVNVYATITNGNIKWDLIKYFYFSDNVLRFIRDDNGDDFDDDYSALVYYNKLPIIKQYELLIEDAYDFLGKDFGWVKDDYLISEQESQENKNIFESQMKEVESRSENKVEKDIMTNESIIKDENYSDNKDNIFDIIKKFFGLGK